MADLGAAGSGAASGAAAGSALGPWGAAVGGVAGGLMGMFSSKGDNDQARAAQEAALKYLAGVNVPGIDEQTLNLAGYNSVGSLNPALEQSQQQGANAMANISTDPRLKDAQMAALAQMQQLGRTGMTASDQAALNQARISSDRDAQGQQQAIMQNMAARGQWGNGNELAARMIASQNSSNNNSAQADRTAAMAQQNALAAMAQAGTLGGQMQSQSFNQQAAQAQAQNAINQFNTQNRQASMARNTAAQNSAQQYNLQNQQNVANQNVNLSNQQQVYNKGLYQQQFGDQMQKAGAMAGQSDKDSKFYQDQADRTSKMWSSIGQGVGSGIGGIADYYNKQPGDPNQAANQSIADVKVDKTKNMLADNSNGYSQS